MNRKIVAGLTAAAVAVALSACAGGSASGGAGGPADDSTRYKRPDRSGPLSPDSASAPATGTVSASSGAAGSSTTR